MTKCHRLSWGRFDDGIAEVPSPDGEYTGEPVNVNWHKERIDETVDSIAPFWE